MPITYKAGVAGLIQSPLFAALRIADTIYTIAGHGLVVTSLRDSSQHQAGSLHYRGLAADLRIAPLGARHSCEVIRLELKRQLGADYDVALEHDHIHLEYDPHHDGGKSLIDGDLLEPPDWPQAAPIS